jgi:hypothetical protein
VPRPGKTAGSFQAGSKFDPLGSLLRFATGIRDVLLTGYYDCKSYGVRPAIVKAFPEWLRHH